MTSTRRSLLAASAVLPFLRMSARAATTPGKLVFGLSSYPPTMAPWANAGTAAATAKLMFHRGLLGYDANGNLRGELAEKWEHADDGAWVLHLRDAVFQNGAPVTSADVAWTIEQVAGEKSTAYLRAEMQRITKIDTPDAKTVRLVTKEPMATLPYLLASYFLPILAKDSTTDNPLGIGAGPFRLTNQERGVALEFEAFDKFYRPGLPKVKSRPHGGLRRREPAGRCVAGGRCGPDRIRAVAIHAEHRGGRKTGVAEHAGPIHVSDFQRQGEAVRRSTGARSRLRMRSGARRSSRRHSSGAALRSRACR